MHAPAKWRDGLLLALGLALIVAPLLLDFVSDARAAWHALLAGALLFTLGAAALHRQPEARGMTSPRHAGLFRPDPRSLTGVAPCAVPSAT